MSTPTELDPDHIERLVERIKPLLAGLHPVVQGLTLAELTAIWLHGHFVLGDETETEKLRTRLLEQQIDCIRDLLETYGDNSQ
jgi:hypothetical protein